MMRKFKFYSNENLPFEMVLALRELNYNVLTSYEAGQANQAICDEDVLAFAKNENRVLITLNRDDFLKLHLNKIEHSGIIICKDDRNYKEQIESLHSCLELQEDLLNQLIRVKKQNQPGLAKQIFIIQILQQSSQR